MHKENVTIYKVLQKTDVTKKCGQLWAAFLNMLMKIWLHITHLSMGYFIPWKLFAPWNLFVN
jgi:hypothetical protein